MTAFSWLLEGAARKIVAAAGLVYDQLYKEKSGQDIQLNFGQEKRVICADRNSQAQT